MPFLTLVCQEGGLILRPYIMSERPEGAQFTHYLELLGGDTVCNPHRIFIEMTRQQPPAALTGWPNDDHGSS